MVKNEAGVLRYRVQTRQIQMLSREAKTVTSLPCQSESLDIGFCRLLGYLIRVRRPFAGRIARISHSQAIMRAKNAFTLVDDAYLRLHQSLSLHDYERTISIIITISFLHST
jgi:hypothetical protein